MINTLHNVIAGKVLSYLDLRTVLPFSMTSRKSKEDYELSLDVLVKTTQEKIDGLSKIDLSNPKSEEKEIGHYINIMLCMHKNKLMSERKKCLLISDDKRADCDGKIKAFRERAEEFVNKHMQAEITDLFELIEGKKTDEAITQIKDNPLLVFATDKGNSPLAIATDTFRSSLVHIAARFAQKEVVEVLVELGADVNKADGDGDAPLSIAAQTDHLDIVKALLAAGADVNKANGYDLTALHLAAGYGHVDVVEELIKHDVDLNQKDIDGCTALALAEKFGQTEVAKVLCAAKMARSIKMARSAIMVGGVTTPILLQKHLDNCGLQEGPEVMNVD